MANELCASGFSRPWDGNYTLISDGLWTNGSYFIFRDPWYWYVSSSLNLYYEPYRKASRPYDIYNPSPAGNFTGLDGNPDGIVNLGIC